MWEAPGFLFILWVQHKPKYKAGREVHTSICRTSLLSLTTLSASILSSSPDDLHFQHRRKTYLLRYSTGKRVNFTSNTKSQMIYLRCRKRYEEDAEGYFTCRGVVHRGDAAACVAVSVARAPPGLRNNSSATHKSCLAASWSWSFGHRAPVLSLCLEGGRN